MKSHLSDEVCEEVDNVEDQFESILERLDQKYGNRGRLIDNIMADIKLLHVCIDAYSLETLTLINVVEKAHRDLIRLGEESQMDNATIVSMIEQKLPDAIINEWIKLVAEESESGVGKFPILMKLLHGWRSRVEYKVATIRRVDNQLSGSTHYGQGNTRGYANQSQRQTCWIHRETGEHPIWRCRQFQSIPVTERIKLARENNACFSCLETGHMIDQCTRRFRCTENGCKQKHNRLLHQNQVRGGDMHTGTDLRDSSATGATMLQIQET